MLVMKRGQAAVVGFSLIEEHLSFCNDEILVNSVTLGMFSCDTLLRP